MISREVSLFVFYNQKGEILLQDRRDISKAGEEWGFFGGSLENNETPQQALIREVKEELNISVRSQLKLIDVTEMSYFNDKQGQKVKLKRNIFVKRYHNERFKVMEGMGAKWFDIAAAKKLKLVPGDTDVVLIVENFLKGEE